MSETEEKSLPASPRKLRKKREEGAVPSGQDLAGLTATAIGILGILGLSPLLLRHLSAHFDRAFENMLLPFESALIIGEKNLISTIGWSIGPIIGITIVTILVATIVFNQGIPFSLKPVMPQLDRVSIKSGFKRIYGRRGWIETGAGAVRLFVWISCVIIIAYIWVRILFRSWGCEFVCQSPELESLAWYLGIAAACVLLFAAAMDALLQKFLFLHEQMMTPSEKKREQKEQAGSPEVRKERRRLQRTMNEGADSVGLPRANMCFFWRNSAIAVRFLPPDSPLPRITFKAHTAEEVSKLRSYMQAADLPALEEREIVEKSISAELGDVINKDTFVEFGQALRKMGFEL